MTSWSQKDSLPAGFVYSFAQGDGQLWIRRLSVSTASTVCGSRRGTASATFGGSVRADDGARRALWVGLGDGGGIVRITRGKVRAFGQLTASVTLVAAIAEDTAGIIWAGTDRSFRFAHDAMGDSAHGA